MASESELVGRLESTDASRVAASTMEMIKNLHGIDQESNASCLQSFERRIAFLEDVQEALQVEKSKQRRQRNSFAPISRLPVELLVNIIQAAYEENVYPITYYRRLLEFSSVSYSWHNIVFGSPPLWNYVGTDMPTSAILQVIGKSRVVPLRVYLHCHFHGRKIDVSDFLEMALPFRSRWLHLSIEDVSSQYVLALHPIWSETMPLLRSLKISNRYHYTRSAAFPAHDPFKDTVFLQNVYLKNVTMAANAKILGGLKSLHLDSVKLVQDHRNDSPLVEILSRCPDIEFIHIEDIRDGAGYVLRTIKPSTAIELRALRSVNLRRNNPNDQVADHLVESIVAPQCTVLCGSVAPGPGLAQLCEWIRLPCKEDIEIQLDIKGTQAWLTAREGDRTLDICIGNPHPAENWHWLETLLNDLPVTSILSVLITNIDLGSNVGNRRFCYRLLDFPCLEKLQIADCTGMPSLYELMSKPVEDETGSNWAFPALRSWAISFRKRMDDVGFLPMLRTRYIARPKLSRGKVQSSPPEPRALDHLHVWGGRIDTLPKVCSLLPDVDITTGRDDYLFSRR